MPLKTRAYLFPANIKMVYNGMIQREDSAINNMALLLMILTPAKLKHRFGTGRGNVS